MRKYKLVFVIFYVSFSSCDTNDKNKSKINNTLSIEYQNFQVEKFLGSKHTIRDLAISPDRKAIFHTIQSQKFKQSCIVQRAIDHPQDEPKIVSFSGRYRDLEPFFHPNGKKLYFASDRPNGEGSVENDFNIWAVDFENGLFGLPHILDTTINKKGNEFYPSVSSNGNLYFTAERSDGYGGEDIYVSKFINNQYHESVPVDSVSTRGYEFNAYVSPDESFLICTGYRRENGLGQGDLFLHTKRGDGIWSSGNHLSNDINSSALDFSPYYDPATQNLYFCSDRDGLTANEFGIRDYSTLIKKLEDDLNGSINIYRINYKL